MRTCENAYLQYSSTRVVTRHCMAARNANVITQMGTHNNANDNYRRVVELIQSGAIGKVSEAHVWNSRAWGWHGANDRYIVIDMPKQSQPIPKSLNWDLWVGPAQETPFHNHYFEGPLWYRWWNGNGTMSDLGSHWIDLPFWALKLDAPLTIEAKGPRTASCHGSRFDGRQFMNTELEANCRL